MYSLNFEICQLIFIIFAGSKLSLRKNFDLLISSEYFCCMERIKLHCVSRKHPRLSSAVAWSNTVRF